MDYISALRRIENPNIEFQKIEDDHNGDFVASEFHADYTRFYLAKCIKTKTKTNCDFSSHSSRYRTTDSIVFAILKQGIEREKHKKPKWWRIFEIAIHSMNRLSNGSSLFEFDMIIIVYLSLLLPISLCLHWPFSAVPSYFVCSSQCSCCTRSIIVSPIQIVFLLFFFFFAAFRYRFVGIVNVCKFLVGDRI